MDLPFKAIGWAKFDELKNKSPSIPSIAKVLEACINLHFIQELRLYGRGYTTGYSCCK